MRISRIVPEEIGKFGKGSPPLDIPTGSFVVVFGANEAGKSTYSDLAVTLLSKRYDTSILSRYKPEGGGEVALRGRVELEEPGTAPTAVSFKSKAKLPARPTDVLRDFKPADSAIARVLEKLPNGIVRHLFRLDSLEMAEGVSQDSESVKKLVDYSKGNKAGVKVSELLSSWEGEAASLDRDLVGFNKTIVEKKDQRDVAKHNSAQLDGEERILEAKRGEADHLTKKCEDLLEEKNIANFAKGLRGMWEKSTNARRRLAEIADEGNMVPEVIDKELLDRFRAWADEIKGIELDTLQEHLRGKDSESRQLESEITVLGDVLNADLIAFRSNPKYNTEPSTTRVTDAVKKLGRDHRELHSDLKTSEKNLHNLQSKLASHLRDFDLKNEQWDKWKMGMEAHEYLRTNSGQVDVADRAGVRESKLRLLPAFVSVVATIIAFVAGQIPLVVLSLTAAIVGLFMALSRSSQSTAIGTSDSEVRQKILDLANDIVNLSPQIATLDRDIDEMSKALQLLKNSSIPKLLDEATKIGEEINASFQVDLPESELNAWCDQLADLARKVRESKGLSAEIVELKASEETERERFDGLKRQIEDALKRVGLSRAPELMGSPVILVKTLNAIHQNGIDQLDLRSQILEYERSRRANYDGDSRVEKYFDPDFEKRRGVEIASELQALYDQLKVLNDEIRDHEEQAKKLEQLRQLPALNSEIESLAQSVRSSQIGAARLRVQASIVEEIARNMSGLTMPRLLERINEIVRSVAKEWASVEISDDGNVRIHQGVSVLTGMNLSRGASSLLGTAIRLVIMKVEAEESDLRLPLICDDPLIHLDGKRLKELLRFMNEHSDGHQIIYFTCKDEVKQTAEELGIPVIELV